jgi:hypothetical protein
LADECMAPSLYFTKPVLRRTQTFGRLGSLYLAG